MVYVALFLAPSVLLVGLCAYHALRDWLRERREPVDELDALWRLPARAPRKRAW